MKYPSLLAALLVTCLLNGCRCTEPSGAAGTPDATDVPSAPPRASAGDTGPRPGAAPLEPSERVFRDANGNGVEDSEDINNGTSLDEDANGIPDEVEDS